MLQTYLACLAAILTASAIYQIGKALYNAHLNASGMRNALIHRHGNAMPPNPLNPNAPPVR